MCFLYLKAENRELNILFDAHLLLSIINSARVLHWSLWWKGKILEIVIVWDILSLQENNWTDRNHSYFPSAGHERSHVDSVNDLLFLQRLTLLASFRAFVCTYFTFEWHTFAEKIISLQLLATCAMASGEEICCVGLFTWRQAGKVNNGLAS